MIKFIVNGDLTIFDPFGKLTEGSTITDEFGSIYLMGDKRVYIPDKGWGLVVKKYVEIQKIRKTTN